MQYDTIETRIIIYNDNNIITNNNSNSITALVIFVKNKNLL